MAISSSASSSVSSSAGIEFSSEAFPFTLPLSSRDQLKESFLFGVSEISGSAAVSEGVEIVSWISMFSEAAFSVTSFSSSSIPESMLSISISFGFLFPANEILFTKRSFRWEGLVFRKAKDFKFLSFRSVSAWSVSADT